MEIYDIVKKLVGPIHPVGETYEDEDRLENLEVMTELVGEILFDISVISDNNKDRVEHSMKEAGKFAYEFLETIKKELI